MVIEIKYLGGDPQDYISYAFRHDGGDYVFRDISLHVNNNGHERETVCFTVPTVESFKVAQNLKEKIEYLFDAKGLPKRVTNW